MDEEAYGRAWRALAAKEGHRSRLPVGRTGGRELDPQVAKRRIAVEALIDAGMAPAQIAEVLKIPRDTVRDDRKSIENRRYREKHA